MTIAISANAYDAASMLDEFTFRPFPAVSGNKDAARNELVKKGIVEKQGDKATATYRLAHPIADLHARPKPTVNATPRRGKVVEIAKPSAIQVAAFLEAVRDEQTRLQNETFTKLTLELNEVKQNYALEDNEAKSRELLHLCRKLECERHALSATTWIDALKKVSGWKNYKAFQWDAIISHDVKDYPNGDVL